MKSNHVDARKLAAQIIKTSAVVMQIDPNDAAFAYHVKPRTLAMNAMQ
ncbi:MAG: hypothetical protein K2X93_26580 [Candidatus Obscuribacterales bacterium]|nr:hypothetical protein [Candidatus Obscuribacterales bacterium]